MIARLQHTYNIVSSNNAKRIISKNKYLLKILIGILHFGNNFSVSASFIRIKNKRIEIFFFNYLKQGNFVINLVIYIYDILYMIYYYNYIYVILYSYYYTTNQ